MKYAKGECVHTLTQIYLHIWKYPAIIETDILSSGNMYRLAGNLMQISFLNSYINHILHSAVSVLLLLSGLLRYM
jgi:hypothetical protein